MVTRGEAASSRVMFRSTCCRSNFRIVRGVTVLRSLLGIPLHDHGGNILMVIAGRDFRTAERRATVLAKDQT
jgi:hypothetical protein